MAAAKVVGLNSKHLGPESTEPTSAPNGGVRLYNMRYCPFGERALLALSAKNIPYEVVNVNLKAKPEWYLKNKNPLGKVPALEDKAGVVYESLVVAEYLDELLPEPPLLPKDPFDKAQQKILVERLGILPIMGIVLNRKSADHFAALEAALLRYESLLTDDYFGGKQPLWSDYMLWPWFERLAAAVKFHGNDNLNLNGLPKLNAYVQRMKARPEIQRVLKSDESHLKFIESYAERGAPDYDFEAE